MKWNFLSLILKTFSKRKSRKKIPHISANRSPKKASYISGNETIQSTPRTFLIFQETEARKISYGTMERFVKIAS